MILKQVIILACLIFSIISCNSTFDKQTKSIIINDFPEIEMFNNNLLYVLKSGKLLITTTKPYIVDLLNGEVERPHYTIDMGTLGNNSGNGVVLFNLNPLCIIENSYEGYSYIYTRNTETNDYVIYEIDHKNITCKTINIPQKAKPYFYGCIMSIDFIDQSLISTQYYQGAQTDFNYFDKNSFTFEKTETLPVDFAEPINDNMFIFLEEQGYIDDEVNTWKIGIYDSKSKTKTFISDKLVTGTVQYPIDHAHLFQVIPQHNIVVFVSKPNTNEPGSGIWNLELTTVSYKTFID